ncbi:MAG TPA: GGDEF domain-containing protein [Candidatus Tumulicola sp.]
MKRRPSRVSSDARLLHAATSLLDASRRSPSHVVDAIAQTLSQVERGADVLAVFVVEDGELRCAHVRGHRASYLEGWRLPFGDGRGLVARAAATQVCATMPRDGRGLLLADRSAVAVPWMDGSTLAAIAYASSIYPGAEMSLPAIAMSAAPFAAACEREAVRTEAEIDESTGLLTARAFRRRLDDEIRHASSRRPPAPMCLWFVDVDGFKDVNDRLGHRAGDGVLRTLASLLRAQAVAGLDVAARAGGDEFCLLARATGKARAIERAHDLCAAVNRHAFALAGVTTSIGVAAYPHDASTPGELLDAADRAMYYSKHTGRNRVSFSLAAGRWASVLPEAAVLNPRTSRRWDERSAESFSERSSR